MPKHTTYDEFDDESFEPDDETGDYVPEPEYGTDDCPNCGAEIASGAVRCPQCGEYTAEPVASSGWMLWVLIILPLTIVGLLIYLLR